MQCLSSDRDVYRMSIAGGSVSCVDPAEVQRTAGFLMSFDSTFDGFWTISWTICNIFRLNLQFGLSSI